VAVRAAAPDEPGLWRDERGELHLRVEVFHAPGCPHCREALRFLAALEREWSWLEVRRRDVTADPEARARYAAVAARAGGEARYVPGIAFCDELVVGFDDAARAGARLRTALLACRARAAGAAPVVPGAEPQPPLRIPGLGPVDPASLALPVTTIVLAALDAANPCAFFVLLVLLSVLAHARSRARIAIVGGVFVLFSGLFYFAFMAAWLNAFVLLGELRAVTRTAGAVACLLGLANAWAFLAPGRRAALAIPERAKPSLFRRMRRLVEAARWPSWLAGAVVLAAAANSYELLCTAGFPMVFTRILTLHALPPLHRYGYLALYNVVYVLPLAAVVLAFALTLGSRKLREEEGQALKLLSGLMMLGLGVALWVDPARLERPFAAVALLGAALATTALAVALRRARGLSRASRP
jgi:glutaredoxin